MYCKYVCTLTHTHAHAKIHTHIGKSTEFGRVAQNLDPAASRNYLPASAETVPPLNKAF